MIPVAQCASKAVLRIRCHYCSRFRSPGEIMRIGTGGAVRCWQCYEKHLVALKAFAGGPHPGCQECGVTFRELSERTPGTDIRMAVHMKDGLYQILCLACSPAYVRKRVDLYGSTQFGHQNKLK